MNPAITGILCGFVAYLAGSIPFGLLLGRKIAGRDIRDFGSGNIGATNVARVIGRKWGIVVLVVDCLKGMLPTLLLPGLFAEPGSGEAIWLPVVCGISAVVGHMFPVWLKFRGGKGVATGLGTGLVLSWPATLVALAVFLVCFFATRRTSVASMAAAVTYCAVMLGIMGRDALQAEYLARTAFAIAVPLLIIIRHRSNIIRLLRRQEPVFSAPVTPIDEQENE